MIEKVYQSNLCSLWPFSRQDSVLAEKMNGIEYILYADELNSLQRRKHNKVLSERDQLFRNTMRRQNFRISCASFACLAHNADDLATVLSAAAGSKIELRDLNTGLIVKGRKQWTLAFEAFKKARERMNVIAAGKAGGLKSAFVRSAKVKAAADSCREEWKLKNYSSDELAEKYDVSVGGLKTILGNRRIAQKNHAAAMKRRDAAIKRINKMLYVEKKHVKRKN